MEIKLIKDHDFLPLPSDILGYLKNLKSKNEE